MVLRALSLVRDPAGVDCSVCKACFQPLDTLYHHSSVCLHSCDTRQKRNLKPSSLWETVNYVVFKM